VRRSDSDPSTLVAVVGDHVESLGEHGESTHGMFVYESDVRVPMILWWPGRLPAGRRVPALVRSIDLAPTLLAAAVCRGSPARRARACCRSLTGNGTARARRTAKRTFPACT